MNVLFIADLHLSEERPHITAAFFAFLAEKAVFCERLYILGDFFDAWIGDDDDRLLAAEVAHALRKTSDKGVQIFFQHGNRDFLLSDDYAMRCGMQLLPELYLMELAGRRYLLAHGDQFCTSDVSYQQFRTMVRDPQWQKSFLAKPLPERRSIAANLRTKSREANSLKAEDIMDVSSEAIVLAMQQFNVTTLIHGHTHRPCRHALQLPDGCAVERVVLGEWAHSYWILKMDDTGLCLDECLIS
jgi:UDP-2,3-diacylglucosamine hydrolase